MNSQNYFLTDRLSKICIITLIFIPKIDLIPIANFWQGIRYEDILISCFVIYFFLSKKNNTTIKLNNFQYKNFYYFFLYLFFSNIVGILSGLDVQIVSIIRLIEYIFFLFLIDCIKINKLIVLSLLKYFLLINLFVGIFQIFDLIGSISSLGYKDASNTINQRVLGITGGSWELSILCSLSYLFIFQNEKSKLQITIFFIITSFLVIVSESKTQTAAFIILKAILLIKNGNLLLLIIIVLAAILSILNIEINIFIKLKEIDLSYLYELTYNVIFQNKLPRADEIKDQFIHLSYWYRLRLWQYLANEYTTNIFTIFFGTGFTRIYVESLWIRVLFSSGFIGLLYILYLVRNMNIIYIIYFSIAGLTLDLFVSLKIFLFTLIIVKKNFYEK